MASITALRRTKLRRLYVGEPDSDVRLALPTRLRLILGLAAACWIAVGLAAYAVIEILMR